MTATMDFAKTRQSHRDKFYAKCGSLDSYNHVRKVIQAGYKSQTKRPTDGPSARVAVQGQTESESVTKLTEQVNVLESTVQRLQSDRRWDVDSDNESDTDDGGP